MFKKYMKHFSGKMVEVVLNSKISSMKSDEGYVVKSEVPLAISGYLLDEDFFNLYFGDNKEDIVLVVRKTNILMLENVEEKQTRRKEYDSFDSDPIPSDNFKFN